MYGSLLDPSEVSAMYNTVFYTRYVDLKVD